MLLFIDTVRDKTIRLALVDRKKTIKKDYPDQGHLSEHLVFSIKKFLVSNKIALKDIKKIAVTLGPGGFSRVRSGVVAANTLAYALNKPVIGVRSDVDSDLTGLLLMQGSRSVSPEYGKEPNITKPKRNKIRL
jgi:tRNA threonylcarbamoyl adenosine modification protein YeaZ